MGAESQEERRPGLFGSVVAPKTPALLLSRPH